MSSRFPIGVGTRYSFPIVINYSCKNKEPKAGIQLSAKYKYILSFMKTCFRRFQ
ncbi:hypothetical protein P278_27220 [Zhouia amylolytica AD3]|uniref:Uncharacterized protein n=1 Tax=Zhouia amylolytica AD3 TaxID=1286632 RepID=W2UKX0_9FLAO|nr:hypothetical protein P278_27220 [Zhouia amylolytica AD3]